jgi:hypothetical protein
VCGGLRDEQVSDTINEFVQKMHEAISHSLELINALTDVNDAFVLAEGIVGSVERVEKLKKRSFSLEDFSQLCCIESDLGDLIERLNDKISILNDDM